MRSSYAVAAALVVITGSAALAGQVVQPSMLQQNKGQPIIANPEVVPAQPRMPSATDLHIGIGVICNTNRQAQNYVKLRARGIEISMAVNSVNSGDDAVRHHPHQRHRDLRSAREPRAS
jgi:hypothetical protein